MLPADLKAVANTSRIFAHQRHENIELNVTLESHKERFKGIGRAMRDGQEIQMSVPMKENATPIAQKPRRVPYLLTEPLKKCHHRTSPRA